MTPPFILRQNGDAALDICFDATPGESLSRLIIYLQTALEDAMGSGQWPELRELIPAYQSLTLCYDPLSTEVSGDTSLHNRLCKFVAEILSKDTSEEDSIGRHSAQLIEVPVCYGGAWGPDIGTVCEHTGLSEGDVIKLHSERDYLVHMLGFTPGFLYLGGLIETLHCPRKDRPTLAVPAGSIGIGGTQTGIYPQVTPGGWQIIGRTPLKLFSPEKPSPFIARPLDRVRFVPISAQAFTDWDEPGPRTSPVSGKEND